MELGQQVLDPLLLARQRLDHLAQLGHLGLRVLLGALGGQRELVEVLFPGVALPGEVINGRGPAEHLLRVAAGEEREGLVRRAAHIARRGEPGELVVRGGELAVQSLTFGGRLGVGFRPAEHLQLTAVLLGQLGRLVLQLRHGRRGVRVEQPASHAISGEGGRGHRTVLADEASSEHAITTAATPPQLRSPRPSQRPEIANRLSAGYRRRTS